MHLRLHQQDTLYMLKKTETQKRKEENQKGFKGGGTKKLSPKCRPGQHRPSSTSLPSPLLLHHHARYEPCARSSPIRVSRRIRLRPLHLVKDPIRPPPQTKTYTQQRSSSNNNDKDNWVLRLSFEHIVEHGRIAMLVPGRQQWQRVLRRRDGRLGRRGRGSG